LLPRSFPLLHEIPPDWQRGGTMFSPFRKKRKQQLREGKISEIFSRKGGRVILSIQKRRVGEVYRAFLGEGNAVQQKKKKARLRRRYSSDPQRKEGKDIFNRGRNGEGSPLTLILRRKSCLPSSGGGGRRAKSSSPDKGSFAPEGGPEDGRLAGSKKPGPCSTKQRGGEGGRLLIPSPERQHLLLVLSGNRKGPVSILKKKGQAVSPEGSSGALFLPRGEKKKKACFSQDR